MKQKNLYLMCGVPGSGKSTWVKERMKIHREQEESATCVSRDSIRFLMLKDGEDYFSREDEVFKTFIESINAAINSEVEHIYIDATHLSERARNQVLDLLHSIVNGYSIIPVNFIISLETCLNNNEKRIGRAYVPRSVIKRMYTMFTPAKEGEKYSYKEIITIGE